MLTSAEEEFNTDSGHVNKAENTQQVKEKHKEKLKTKESVEIPGKESDTDERVSVDNKISVQIGDIVLSEIRVVGIPRESDLKETITTSGKFVNESRSSEIQQEEKCGEAHSEKESESESSKESKTEKMFRTLSIETDINVAPVNWLRGDEKLAPMVQESCYWSISDAPELSSIHMAAQHAKKLLSADVISDSRNIKKLLKIAKDVEEVSMAVHRIGKTLLLDEFPIESYIPQRHEKLSKKKKKKKKSATHVNTISKFLYHTLLQNNHIGAPDSNVVVRRKSLTNNDIIVGMGDPLSKITLELPQVLNSKLYSPPDYNRTVFWEFEDIQMLLGNNMPIFGGGEYPAISLKLRDMKEQINVLTGIDCWLDNLICNVPELAMCWHLDGFIQGYELYKTEEIPDLENCKFDPVVIKDLATNVLKFLKSRCVKEGHTYWLYRAKGDDIVKLYDLSSICTGINLTEMNPFSTPVAMLCFKVAQRLYEEARPEDRNTIYTLLQNTLNLIPSKTYPQMEATAHFMIADLFLSNTFTVTKEKKIRLTVQPLFECQFENLPNLFECSIKRDLLDTAWEPPQQQYYWNNIAPDLQVQKKMSLTHIVAALDLVSHQSDSWAVKLQKLLLFKATAIFLHESQRCQGSAVFTNALLSLTTIDAYNSLLYFKDTKYTHGYGYDILRCLVLCHVADTLLTEILSANMKSSTSLSTLDSILLSLNNYARSFDINCTKIFEWCYFLVPEGSISKRVFSTQYDTRETGLLLCLDMYLEASEYEKDWSVRKLGFVYNELASYNLNLISLEETIQEDVAKKLLKQSFEHYKSALNHFQDCTDIHNIALVYSNLGKVMRISGQLQARFYYGSGERGELLYEEKEFYKEAIGYYNNALDTLRKPSVQKDIWCAVSNELSGVYFTMATVMQDCSASSSDKGEVIREVTNLYNKSLRISEGLVREGFTPATGRTGGTHHKLASLYHAQARDTCHSVRKLKRLFSLSDSNYEKAMSYFKESGFEMEYIQVVMEYVGLLQYSSTAPCSALSACSALLSKLPRYLKVVSLGTSRENEQVKMLSLLRDQTLSLLKSIVLLVKQGKSVDGFVCEGASGGGGHDAKMLYAAALRGFQGFDAKNGVVVLTKQVSDVLKLLE